MQSDGRKSLKNKVRRSARLATVIRDGWLVPALEGPGAPPPRVPTATLRAVLRGLDADRADRPLQRPRAPSPSKGARE